MRILDLAIKDLRQIGRERQSAFFLLIMPLLFTVLFGFAFGGFDSGSDDDPRLPVGILNQDEGGVTGHLVALLGRSDVLRLVSEAADRDTLAQQVANGELAAALVVPPNFSRQLEAGTPRPLTLIIDPAGAASFTIQGEVDAAFSRLATARLTARLSTEIALDAGDLVTAGARQAFYEAALARAAAAWADPPVQVRTQSTGAISAGPGDEAVVYGANAFAHSSPGMMAQFVMAGLITAAQILVLERKSGALRRLLTTNMSRGGILVGHYLAMFVMIVVQLLSLCLFGQLLLRLPYFGAPAATMLLVLTSALFAASMGLLIGALSQSEEQAIVFSLVPMFILAGLGGAWLPLEFTPATVQQIARLTPIAWMVDGFKDIIIRGQGLEAVLPAAAVLLLYGVLFWLLAAWRFRFE